MRRTLQLLPELPRVFAGQLVSTSANPSFRPRSERFCAVGRMLFLSLYEPSPRKLTKQELYDRCHEMIDWVKNQLAGAETKPRSKAGGHDRP